MQVPLGRRFVKRLVADAVAIATAVRGGERREDKAHRAKEREPRAHADYFPKSTLGAPFASSGAAKYGYSAWKPKILPVMFDGKLLRSVL